MELLGLVSPGVVHRGNAGLPSSESPHVFSRDRRGDMLRDPATVLSFAGAAGVSSSPGVRFNAGSPGRRFMGSLQTLALGTAEGQLSESLQHCSFGLPEDPESLQYQRGIAEVSFGTGPQYYHILDFLGDNVFWNSCIMIDRGRTAGTSLLRSLNIITV